MATRFDQVTVPTRPTNSRSTARGWKTPARPLGAGTPPAEVHAELEELLHRLDIEQTSLARAERALGIGSASTTRTRTLPVRVLAPAMATWLFLVFMTCYLVLPLGLAITGVSAGVLGAAPFSLPAFALASLVAIVGAAVARPTLRLDPSGPRDPVIAATVGGLGVWAVIHNTSSLLLPFTAMNQVELATFLGLNVLEMSMLGMMFASFTRRASVALALGGGFQLLVLGLVLTLMSIATL